MRGAYCIISAATSDPQGVTTPTPPTPFHNPTAQGAPRAALAAASRDRPPWPTEAVGRGGRRPPRRPARPSRSRPSRTCASPAARTSSTWSSGRSRQAPTPMTTSRRGKRRTTWRAARMPCATSVSSGPASTRLHSRCAHGRPHSSVCPESPPRQRSLPSRRRRPRKRRSRCRCSTCRTVTPTPSLRSRRASRGPLHAPARRQGLRGLQGQADAARQDDRAQSAGAARRHPRGCRRGHRHQVLGRRARATAYAARRLSDSRGF